jgi:DNA-directed RNA polymerase subunit RPC12/RpoP
MKQLCDGCWEESEFELKVTRAYEIPSEEGIFELCDQCASKILVKRI